MITRTELESKIVQLRRDLAKAEKRSAAFAERRASIRPGASRARTTTANARWARAAEHRDRLLLQLAELENLKSEVKP